MKNYSACWRATIFAAIVLHIVAAMIYSYVVPMFAPKPKIETLVELEWVDLDAAEEVVIIDAETIPSDETEPVPTFDAEALRVPELPTPEPIKLPELSPPKPIERPKPKPKPVEEKPAVQKPEPKPADEKPADDKTDKNPDDNDTRRMKTPPVTLTEVFPEKGNFDFKGYVSLAVRIGKDGKVKSTEILQSSGQSAIDESSVKAAMQWTFRPALDQLDRPMECDKIITFDFKKIS